MDNAINETMQGGNYMLDQPYVLKFLWRFNSISEIDNKDLFNKKHSLDHKHSKKGKLNTYVEILTTVGLITTLLFYWLCP